MLHMLCPENLMLYQSVQTHFRNATIHVIAMDRTAKLKSRSG